MALKLNLKDRLQQAVIDAKDALEDVVDINDIKSTTAAQIASYKEKATNTAIKISDNSSDLIEQLDIDNKITSAKKMLNDSADYVKENCRNFANEVMQSEAYTKLAENCKSLMASKAVTTTVDKATGVLQIISDKVNTVIADQKTQEILSATTQIAQRTGQLSVKGLRVVSGVQAVQDRRRSLNTKEEADRLKVEIEEANEAIRDDLNESLDEFGRYKILALKKTVGVFLNCLERMNQKSKAKEYEFLRAIDIQEEEVKEMEQVDMKASDTAKVLAVGGGFAAIALMGTPALVTGAVTAMCAASTGTAISTLSGAAAHAAVMAWLGGGTIAAGGGGMAAGTVVLGALTATAAIGVAVVAVGTLSSAYYAKKATEATEYLADIKIWAAETEKSWVVMNGIKSRVLELQRVMQETETRSIEQLSKFQPIVDNFDAQNMEHVELFQQSAILVKSMSELAQTPILDDNGNFNEQANIVLAKTEKILNKNL